MNSTSKIVTAALLLLGIFLWIKDCSSAHKKIIENALRNENIATAVIESKRLSNQTYYVYKFNVDSVEYTGSTNADLNKKEGDTISICYSVQNPSSNYYADKSSGYRFSVFDLIAGLILISIVSVYLIRIKSKNK
jgi:hypothetical protein